MAPRLARWVAFTGIFLLAAEAAPTLAGWSIFSHHERLREKAVVDVGEVSARRHTTFGSFRWDPLLEMEVWHPGETIEWTEFVGREKVCMPEDPLDLSLNSEPALLLTDATKQLYLARIESVIGSIKVEVTPVFLVKCPSRY